MTPASPSPWAAPVGVAPDGCACACACTCVCGVCDVTDGVTVGVSVTVAVVGDTFFNFNMNGFLLTDAAVTGVGDKGPIVTGALS